MAEHTDIQEYQRFKLAFQAGAEQVIIHKKELNDINVFPVSDGDTGNNLAALMQTIKEAIDGHFPSTLSLFERLADASLVGARGNSGNILAQYFNGLYDNLCETSEHTFLDQFVASTKLAVDDAYHAVGQPVEGTILTVIRSWGDALAAQSATLQIEERLTKALVIAKNALENTTGQLKILQKNQVVDSGAKGFYLFIEGFTLGFTNQAIPVVIPEESTEIDQVVHRNLLITEVPTQRYCIEVLLEHVAETSEAIQSSLKGVGESTIVSVNRGKARIHVHANHPSEIVDKLRTFGQPIQQKIDDMLLQYHVSQTPKAKIALVTDSIADIPADYVLSEQIHVLPMTILMGQASYLDRLTIKNQQFFELQQSLGERGSSAQPGLSQIDSLFRFLEGHYEAVIVVTVSQKMSGTFDSIKRIAEKILPVDRLAVIDSKQNSAAQGLLIMRVNQWIQAGLGLKEIADKAKQWTQHVAILVSVDDIDPMINSGRVPEKAGRLAQKLHLKPLVTIADGAGKLVNFSFGLTGNEKKMLKKIMKLHQKKQLLSYGIVYASQPDRAEKWQHDLRQKLGMAPTFVLPISTAVALSAGDGSVAIAYEFDKGDEEK